MSMEAENANSLVSSIIYPTYTSIGLGDDAPFEIKKPRKPTIFD
jgi:hypothetical protein